MWNTIPVSLSDFPDLLRQLFEKSFFAGHAVAGFSKTGISAKFVKYD